MNLKLVLVFGFLFQVCKNFTLFSFSLYFLYFQAVSAYKCTNDSWDGVYKMYNGTSKVLTEFPIPTYRAGATMLSTFVPYSSLLEYLANSNSTILSSRSIAILKAIALLSELKDSAKTMLIEFNKVLSKVAAELRNVVSSLFAIGKLTVSINEDITNIERSLNNILKEFLNNGIERLRFGKKTDFEPVMKSLQVLLNIIRLIAETVLKDHQLATLTDYESVTILILILPIILYMIQGTDSSITTIIYTSTKHIPDTLQLYLQSVDFLITDLAYSINSIRNSFADSAPAFLASVIKNIISFNAILADRFELVDGVAIANRKVTSNLPQSLPSITQGITSTLILTD